jgi:hypothetical protein
MAFARTETYEQRAAILDRLTSRNRLVAILRIAVPAAGLVALLFLAAQIYVMSTLRQYGVAGIRIDRGHLVVETPQYSAMGSNGARYLVSAGEARTPFDDPSIIDMTNAKLDFARPGESTFHASAPNASFDTSRQYVIAPGMTTVRSDDGLHGTLTALEADIANDSALANGPVDVTFQDGSNLTAANMHYDGKAEIWTFDRATLIVPELPGSPLPPVPGFAIRGWVRA